jgi:hypothetical protein
MLEQRQDASLLEKPSHESRHRMPDQLDRNSLIEVSVVAMAEQYLAHATFADRSLDAERTDSIRRGAGRGTGRLEQQWTQVSDRRVENAARVMMRAEKLKHFGVKPGIVGAGALDERGLFGGR